MRGRAAPPLASSGRVRNHGLRHALVAEPVALPPRYFTKYQYWGSMYPPVPVNWPVMP